VDRGGLLAPRPGWSLSRALLFWVAIPALGSTALLLLLFALQRLHSNLGATALTRTLVDVVAVTAEQHVNDAMLLGGDTRTALWIRDLGSFPQVESIHLVSPAYRIAVSPEPAAIGRPVEDESVRAAFTRLEVQVERSDRQYRLVVPLKNQASCHSCHGVSGRVLGALDLRLRRDAGVNEPMGSFLLFAALLIVTTLGGAAAMVLRMVDRYVVDPIRRLSSASRSLASGEAGAADVGDAPVEIVGLASDLASMARQIREQCAAVTRVRRDNDQVRVLAGIGEMAARVAHEVRNPLNSIEGAAFYLGNHLAGDEVAREYLGLIRTEVARISAVAADLLSAARPTAPSMERFGLEELVQERCRLMTLVQLERTAVEVSASPDLPPIFADRRQLSQVLDNLLENAVQAVAGRGGIRVRIEAIDRSALQRSLRVTVEDDGPGLSDEASEKLFTPFFTTKPQGTGLGLIIVRKIVEAHRGSFSIRNAPGGGAQAIVELPV
jgi:signal transduction histidine kinase